MKERNMPEGIEDNDLVRFTIGYEVYLIGREDPVRTFGTFELRKDLLRDEPLENLMQVVINHVFATIDVVAEHRLILSDEKYNKTIFLTKDIQGIAIQAPEEATILAALEG